MRAEPETERQGYTISGEFIDRLPVSWNIETSPIYNRKNSEFRKHLTYSDTWYRFCERDGKIRVRKKC